MSVDTLTIPIQSVAKSRISELDFNNIEFGKNFADHMFVVDYKEGAWQNPQILPYGPMALSPATSALHYGQAVFEGMKAYKSSNDDILLFRPYENHRRLNISAQRMCMPTIPEELFIQGLEQLLRQDAAWVPPSAGSALYLRPFMFATDDFIGVRPSASYRFCVFSCPVGSYYAQPLRVAIETKYVRSAEGGAGYAKAAGNYGAALYPAKQMQEKGYHQLIWTDAREHKYIEESGTMNVMFVIDDVLITPATSTTILEGITRKSILQLARDMGYTVEERRVSVAEVVAAQKAGKLQEAFGAGTAATIAQIAVIHHDGEDLELPPLEGRTVSNTLAAALDQIKTGQTPDRYNWLYPISI